MISRTAIALFISVSLSATTAHAQCAASANLGWTFPADGQTDVPVNTLIWVQTSDLNVAEVQVSLDGVRLQSAQPPHAYQPQAMLSSNSVHLVHVEIPSRFGPYTDAGPDLSADFSFTTGDTSVTAIPSAPNIQDVTFLDGGGTPLIMTMTDMCKLAVMTQGCFDVAPDDSFQIDFTGDAIAYQVDINKNARLATTYLLPQSCTPTTEATLEAVDHPDAGCVEIRGFNAAGQAGPVTEKCVSLVPAGTKSGCSSGTGEAALGVLALLGVALRIRRRR